MKTKTALPFAVPVLTDVYNTWTVTLGFLRDENWGVERTCRSRTSDKSSQPNRNYSDVCPLQKGKGPTGHNHVPIGTAPGVGMATEYPSIGGTSFFLFIHRFKPRRSPTISYTEATIFGHTSNEWQSSGWKFSDNTDMTLGHKILKQKHVHEI